MIDFSAKKMVTDAPHWSEEINQLYHPSGVFAQDSEDMVYSCDAINRSKFLPILLKEWFFIVKKNGYLVIDYQPNQHCDFNKLEKNMWWLWQGKYEIIYHGAVSAADRHDQSSSKLARFIHDQEDYHKTHVDKESALPVPLPTKTHPEQPDGLLRFICKKTQATIIPGDSMDKWTFGIITNGKRRDWMDKIIASIHQQNIPQYEIIVCGTYYDRKEANFTYLPFNQRDDKGWITKKKNLIVDRARHENICIIHDRIVFDNDWFASMKQWGNCFESMSCVQTFEGKRAGDWVMFDPHHLDFEKKKIYYTAELDYRDWVKNGYIAGMFYIGKKSLFAQQWDETLHWNESEDIELSQKLLAKGILDRFNAKARVQTLAWRFKSPIALRYNPLLDEPKYTGSWLIRLGRKVLYLTSKTFLGDYLISLGWIFFFEKDRLGSLKQYILRLSKR